MMQSTPIQLEPWVVIKESRLLQNPQWQSRDNFSGTMLTIVILQVQVLISSADLRRTHGLIAGHWRNLIVACLDRESPSRSLCESLITHCASLTNNDYLSAAYLRVSTFMSAQCLVGHGSMEHLRHNEDLDVSKFKLKCRRSLSRSSGLQSLVFPPSFSLFLLDCPSDFA
jgi:hypothetical protein